MPSYVLESRVNQLLALKSSCVVVRRLKNRVHKQSDSLQTCRLILHKSWARPSECIGCVISGAATRIISKYSQEYCNCLEYYLGDNRAYLKDQVLSPGEHNATSMNIWRVPVPAEDQRQQGRLEED